MIDRRLRAMAKAELPDLLLPDAVSWRRWLADNHAESPGVRLVLHESGGTVTSLTIDDAVEEALCFGWIDGQANKRDEGSWMVRFTPRRPGSNWSERNIARADRLEREGRMKPAGRAAVEAAKADGRWQPG